MKSRHFLDITDLSARDLGNVMNFAQVEISSLGRPHAVTAVALVFEKPPK